jgi:hypothetical protein
MGPVPAALGADASVTVVAGGDVACSASYVDYNGGLGQPWDCQQRTTADLIRGIAPSKVFALGDLQYENGTLADFNVAYESSWGAFKSITAPVVGNHEYATSGASGYYTYFGAAANPTKGYYSFDIPVGASRWHVVALNAECNSIDSGVGCAVGSPQYQWLQNDLTSNRTLCTAVIMHRPLYASSAQATAAVQPLYDLLYQYRADLVLTGHAHLYERFAPQDAAGHAVADGMREFIVGTGGKDFGSIGTTAANSQVVTSRKFGVLKLGLTETGYNWDYVASAATPFTDSGSDSCHAPQDGVAPSVPQGLATTTAPSSSSVSLGWSGSTDNSGGSGVAGYRVYRSDVTGGPLNSSLVTQPAYTDSTVAAGTTYSYSVSAVDVAGNESARSSPISVTTPAAGSSKTLTFAPTDDATVDASNPTVNSGSSNRLTVDGSPVNNVLLKFNVTGTAGCPVTGAKLRLTVGSTSNDNSAYGGDLYPVSDTSWSESTVTWNTKPAAGTTKVGSIGSAVSLNTSYLVDATPLVKGDGLVSMQLSSANTDGARYWSKDGSTAAQAPQLQVTCNGSGSTTDTTAPSAPGGFTATASSATKVDLAWSASTDNVGVTGYRVYRNGSSTPLASLGSTARGYSDTTAAASTSYTYQVSAVDAAGNQSAKSSASVTTPAAGSSKTLTFAPTDDATVDASNPTVNSGSSNRLTVDGSPVNNVLLKFNVTGTAGCPVTGAKLRLTVGSTSNDNSAYGGDLYPVSDTSWSESTVTWNTKPAAGTTKVGSIGSAVSLNTSYLVDATPLVKGDGLVSMQLSSANTDGARYWSKDGSTAAQAPQLQVTCG